jgi:hypothetical protein
VKNLHAFWDGVMGANNSAEFAAEASARLPKVDSVRAAIDEEEIWIAESVSLAQDVAYRDIPADTRALPVRLSAEYKAAARSAADARSHWQAFAWQGGRGRPTGAM